MFIKKNSMHKSKSAAHNTLRRRTREVWFRWALKSFIEKQTARKSCSQHCRSVRSRMCGRPLFSDSCLLRQISECFFSSGKNSNNQYAVTRRTRKGSSSFCSIIGDRNKLYIDYATGLFTVLCHKKTGIP